MKHTRRILLVISMLMLLAYELDVYAFSTAAEKEYISVVPQKAIISAVIALVIGVIVYLWRHRSQS